MRYLVVVAVVFLAIGCGERHVADVPLDQVPEPVIKSAHEKLPDVKFEQAWKTTNGNYEVRGKMMNGKVCDIQVKPNGEVVEIDQIRVWPMPLADLQLTIEAAALPVEVRTFLHEADRRIERFTQNAHIPGFVPSDFTTAYGALRAVAANDVAPGDLFCEWGSGFGVVACLAAMLGFNACGIEIEEDLVEEAQCLADDFGLPAQFMRGSFIPRGSDVRRDAKDGFDWLSTEDADTEEIFGLAPADFDVIYAYPWPDEEEVIEGLFERHAAVGAVLLAYHGGDVLRAQRKTKRKR